MSFIIKNVDAGNIVINDLGITLVPAEEYDLAQDNANDVALSTDLPAALTAGTVVVLDPLDDVTPLSLSDAQAAVAAMNDTHFRIKGGELNQLDDINITTPTNGQLLTYQSGNWVNQAAAGVNSFETITTPIGGPVVADSSSDTLVLTSSTGIAITGTAGTDTINFAPANDLAALEALATTGFAARTGTETWALRSLTQPAAGLTITNPAGVAGNPTFALANDLAAVEGLGTTGIAVRTAADTWTTRSITGTTNQIAVTNGSGVAGNPVIALANNPIIPGTAGIDIPSGTTAQRPGSPTTGVMRFNTTTGLYEAWNGTQWVNFGGTINSLNDIGDVTITGAQTGDVLRWNGSNWENDYSAIVQVIYGTIVAATGTTQIPFDNTTPLITEGTQMGAAPITPEHASHKVKIEFTCMVGTSTRGANVMVAVFRDSTCIGLYTCTPTTSNQNDGDQILSATLMDSPNTTSTVTYSGRIGVTTGSWLLNTPHGGAPTFGGALVAGAQFLLTELNL